MIKLINLHKNFGKLEVLKGIDLEIKKGEVVSVIGPSGSGKSTLIRCLNLLEQPTSGDILFTGASVLDQRMDIDEYRQHIGMVFQHFNLFSNMDVLKNLTAALTYVKHIKRDVADAKAMELLKMVGLEEKIHAYPAQMSGGQQQRVAIARALVSKPAIVLADEPTGNLDSRTSGDVLSLLKITSNKFHQTLVMITHNNEIAQLADRIIRIEDGRIFE